MNWSALKMPPNQAMLLTALRAAADCQGVGRTEAREATGITQRVGIPRRASTRLRESDIAADFSLLGVQKFLAFRNVSGDTH